MKIPKPGEMLAAREMAKRLLPAVRELDRALENLAEVHARWNKGATSAELDTAIQRVLAARATLPSPP